MVAEPRLMTVTEFMKLPEQTKPTELIDGEVIVTITPTYEHNQIALRLVAELMPVARARKLGAWSVAPLALFISTYNVYQPDAMFFTPEHIPDRKNLPLMEIPEIVVEVLSPSPDPGIGFASDRRMLIGELRNIGSLIRSNRASFFRCEMRKAPISSMNWMAR